MSAQENVGEHSEWYLLGLDLLVAPLLGGIVINEVGQLVLELVVLFAERVEISHIIDHMNCLHLSSKELIVLQLHNLQWATVHMHNVQQKPFGLVKGTHQPQRVPRQYQEWGRPNNIYCKDSHK